MWLYSILLSMYQLMDIGFVFSHVGVKYNVILDVRVQVSEGALTGLAGV